MGQGTGGAAKAVSRDNGPWLILPGFMPDAVGFAARTTLAVLLAYLIAFAIQLDTASSAGLCVAIVAQPTPGMTMSKALYRVLGTVLGGAVGFALVALFPQGRTALLAAFTLWLGACTFVAALLRDFRSYGVNINFLPNAVYEPRACIRATLNAAARTGFNPQRLTFEIVETETITDTPHLLNIIGEYRRQGFKIALDDFATGYSGLARLAELKPDIVKLDRALAQDCDKDRTRLAIIASMIALGAQIDIKVVVEGVERRSEVDALRSVGARFIQGFYFAKPSFKALCRDEAVFSL